MNDDRIIFDVSLIPASLRGCVVTIGNFDGVHLGHQRILRACREAADARRAAVVAVTFDPLPEAVLFPGQAPPLILPLAQRVRRLLAHGADGVVALPVTPDLLALSAQEFVDDLLVRHLAPTLVVEGANFFFGRRREGDITTLETLGRTRGFTVSVVESVRDAGVLRGEGVSPSCFAGVPPASDVPFIPACEGGLSSSNGQANGAHNAGETPAPRETRISSTLIRELVRDGRVEEAAACLGEPFALFGRVVAGKRRGRLMGFPTINVQPGDQAIPGDGVYAGLANIEGLRHLAAVSVGHNPTFAPETRTVEAFLLDTHGDFYDKDVALSFLHRLRDPHRFDSAQALTRQIERDVEAIRTLLGENR